MVATESGDELRRYTELTGRPVDTAALELYRLRWALDDLSCFVRDLRAPHRHTPGTEERLAISASHPHRRDHPVAHPQPLVPSRTRWRWRAGRGCGITDVA